MRRCWRCGTRTRCCAARSPGSATSPPTGSGSPCSPGWSHASAGVRCSRSPLPRYWPGTGDSSPGSGRTLSTAAQDGRVVLHRGGNARQAGQDACHRAFHRSVTGTAAHHLAQFRQAGCTATGARLGEGRVRNGQRRSAARDRPARRSGPPHRRPARARREPVRPGRAPSRGARARQAPPARPRPAAWARSRRPTRNSPGCPVPAAGRGPGSHRRHSPIRTIPGSDVRRRASPAPLV